MKRAISLFFILCFFILPVSAIGEINPSTESQPIWCRFYYTQWICDFGGDGIQGAQGIQGIPGEGNITNVWNLTGNLTTYGTVNIFSEMNQTANMTANMTAGPQGEQGIQGEQGEQGIQG